ncbi:DUF4115 domain-containing protein [Rubrobacter tropicus]|uniref:DUF4115 domain-containing protein n=1 Tax=Rubrobacter tropicus TaxID=2653851 RepID=A0A6G8Q948_9ACTN|nr:helix-turn-helix domain-containing protein [Rubrobacter tropicus]QIN82996.1 DUF4115 domain-containing protein [Rubrobacter tropicus]
MEDGNHTPGSSNGEGKIGRVLERARRDRGLSLEEAERATKIRKRYLVGLEEDDYTVLPDAVYAQGFLKTYANFLGLDGAGLSQELRTRRKPRRERGLSYAPPESEFERPIINPGGVSGARKRKIPRSTIIAFGVAALVIAALIGALYFVGLNVRASTGDDVRAEAPANEEDQRASGGGAGQGGERPASGEQVANEAALDTLRVGVSVEGSPAWIRVRSDSETVFERVAEPGYSRTFEARRVVGIEAGNAGAVSVEVNGQDVGPLGDPGQVLDKSYTLKSAG